MKSKIFSDELCQKLLINNRYIKGISDKAHLTNMLWGKFRSYNVDENYNRTSDCYVFTFKEPVSSKELVEGLSSLNYSIFELKGPIVGIERSSTKYGDETADLKFDTSDLKEALAFQVWDGNMDYQDKRLGTPVYEKEQKFKSKWSKLSTSERSALTKAYWKTVETKFYSKPTMPTRKFKLSSKSRLFSQPGYKTSYHIGDSVTTHDGVKIKITDMFLMAGSLTPSAYVTYDYELPDGEKGKEENSYLRLISLIRGDKSIDPSRMFSAEDQVSKEDGLKTVQDIIDSLDKQIESEPDNSSLKMFKGALNGIVEKHADGDKDLTVEEVLSKLEDSLKDASDEDKGKFKMFVGQIKHLAKSFSRSNPKSKSFSETMDPRMKDIVYQILYEIVNHKTEGVSVDAMYEKWVNDYDLDDILSVFSKSDVTKIQQTVKSMVNKSTGRLFSFHESSDRDYDDLTNGSNDKAYYPRYPNSTEFVPFVDKSVKTKEGTFLVKSVRWDRMEYTLNGKGVQKFNMMDPDNTNHLDDILALYKNTYSTK